VREIDKRKGKNEREEEGKKGKWREEGGEDENRGGRGAEKRGGE